MKKVPGIEYGNTSWTIEVPESAIVFEKLPAEQITQALPDPANAIREALENPLGMDRISEIVKKGSKVTVAFHSHVGHSFISAPIVLDELHKAGVEDSDITFMPGLGTYPKFRRRGFLVSEMDPLVAGKPILPPKIVDKFWPPGTIYPRGMKNHDCSDPKELVFLGYSRLGDYVEYNKCVQESDLVIFLGGCLAPTGTYGAYGGSSGVTIGLGSAKAIGSTHTYSIVSDPRAIHCSPRNNLYREHKHAIQDQIEDATGKPIFNVDGFQNFNSEWSVFNAGHYKEIQEPIWQVLDKEKIVKIPEQVDVTICGCGPHTTYDHANNPLAVLASQVSSHPMKDFLPPKPFCRKGGVVIVCATCDGRISEIRQSDQEIIKIFNKVGQNAANLVDYEDEFYNRDDYLFNYRHARAFHPMHPFWLFYNAQWALDNYTVICAGAQNFEAARSVGMVPAKDFPTAWNMATKILGNKEPLALVLPNRTKRGGVIFKVA